MKLECYAASRARDGQQASANEDAFWILRPDSNVAVLCDGAGHAQRCAAKVVQLFGRQIQSGAFEVERFPAWASWLKSTDAMLAGGPQTTFVGVAAVNDRLVGAYAGDSRAYVINEHGCRLVTESPCRRLGSGEAEPTPIYEPIAPRDIVLLMSDGAWTPLSLPMLHRIVVTKGTQHLSEVPPALIDQAGRNGRLDDMTVIAMRAR